MVTGGDEDRLSVGRQSQCVGTVFASAAEFLEFDDFIELVVSVGVAHRYKPLPIPPFTHTYRLSNAKSRPWAALILTSNRSTLVSSFDPIAGGVIGKVPCPPGR